MPSLAVGCIPESALLQARLRDALGGPGRVRAFPDVAAALPVILRGELRCTVLAIDPPTLPRALDILRVLKHTVPSHAVVAWCEMRALSTRQLLDLAQAGVSELVLRDVDDIRHVLARLLNAAAKSSHAQALDGRLGQLLPPAMRPLFTFALQHAHVATDIDRVAAAFGVTRQTLRNRLVSHALPLPRTFVTWCRLLVAASMLEEPGHTLDSVGLQLDFSSGHHLGTVLRRYVGVGVAEMRTTSVLDAVERAFRDALAHPVYHAADEERTSLPAPSSRD